MGTLKIYTYSNPYSLTSESFWDEIQSLPQLCVSQTLVNGMKECYSNYKTNAQVCTIRRFINALYSNWESQDVKMNQMVVVDQAISQLLNDGIINDNAARSLRFNTRSLVNCIRIFIELGIDYTEFDLKNINSDQKTLIQIYEIVTNSKSDKFLFERNISSESLDKALIDALKTDKEEPNIASINFDTIVIHGIHQFSPAILCAIEDLRLFKNIILLFNYQEQYSSVYETWKNIYSLFDESIKMPSVSEYTPNIFTPECYESNSLADFIGKTINGEKCDYMDSLNSIEVTEYENLTEFSNHCANVFNKARYERKADGEKHSVLAYMEEQFYSPSTKANDILRAYFPEHFGERHFLDYPIGHFFASIIYMWDEEKSCVVVDDYSRIKECLQSGIIAESTKGCLLNTFNNVEAYFEGQKTLNDIIARLCKLKKNLNTHFPEKERIAYFSVTTAELVELINALNELKTIIETFFADFALMGNFKNFYDKIQKFLVSKLDDIEELDSTMVSVIKELLTKLESSDIPDTGSYLCLKNTMRYYLSQSDEVNNGAKWIVRGFEQIDGDILKDPSRSNVANPIYHFCCLDDKNICAANDEKLPWPLDIKFFEYSHAPIDYKYQIFLKSKLEYKNFNRYALLYGLEFNRAGFKLSYIKNENNKENDLFYVLKLLGVTVKKYSDNFSTYVGPKPSLPNTPDINPIVFTELDKYRISICPYKYALETLVQGKTIFRSRFLLHHYMRTIILGRSLQRLQRTPFSERVVMNVVLAEYNSVSALFKLEEKIEKTQLVSTVFDQIKKYYVTKRGVITDYSLEKKANIERKYDLLKYSDDLKLLEQGEIDAITSSKQYRYNKCSHCQYCSCNDICLENTDIEH